MAKPRSRWAVFVGGYACVFTIALTNVWSVFVNPLAHANGWVAGDVQLAYAYYSFIMAASGILSAKLSQKLPLRAVLYFGSACMVISLVGIGLVTSISALYLTFSVLYGVGGGFVYNLSITNTLKWFPDKKGLVSGLLLSGASLGGIVFAPVMNFLFTSFGVRMACLIMAAVFAVYLGSTVWMSRPVPEGCAPKGWTPPAPAAGSGGGTRDYIWTEMIRTPIFWIIFFLFVCSNIGSSMMISSASAIGQAYAGLTPAVAATAVSCMSACNFIGRTFFGWLSDRIGQDRALMISVGICTATMAVISRQNSPVLFVIGMCLTGMCGGSILALLPSMCSDAFGVKNSTMNYSILFLGFAGSSYIAPLIAKGFADNYSMAFLIAGGLCAAGFVLIVLKQLYQRRRKARQRDVALL